MAKRQRCFMEIEVGGVAMGKITMELFNDKCPLTCENFRALCTGEKGIGKTTEKPLHYLSSIFHRVVNGFMIQGGDFSNGNGTGGESIYGGVFPDEDLNTKHDIPFLLSMANRGKDTNGSQFFITTNATPHLDGIHVVFGQVKTGEDIVKYIECLPVDRMCRPMQDVKITRCGELVLKNKAKSKSSKKKKKKRYVSSSDSVSSDSDVEPTPSKTLRKSAGQEVDKVLESTLKKPVDDEEIDDMDSHPLVTVSKIDPDDIPDIPRPRYLLRGDPDFEKTRSSTNAHNRPSNSSSSYQRRQSRYNMVTKSGRHIKGRGKFRFRTPSPSDEQSRERSRSATPPHWRQAQRNTIKMSEYKKKAQSERTNREKDDSSKAPQRFATANGAQNGSAIDLKQNNSIERKENADDRDNKVLSKMSESSQPKQAVELVFVKGSRDDEKVKLNESKVKNEAQELRELEVNPEPLQESVTEKKTSVEENREVKVSTKSEELVLSQPLDLNALDYEVTEFEQAESEHSMENDNENEIETEQCSLDKDVSTNAVESPAAPVIADPTAQAPETQSSVIAAKPIESKELVSDTKIPDPNQKDKTASKPPESATSSSKQPAKRSSSRTRRSSSRTRTSSSRARKSSSRTRRSSSRIRKSSSRTQKSSSRTRKSSSRTQKSSSQTRKSSSRSRKSSSRTRRSSSRTRRSSSRTRRPRRGSSDRRRRRPDAWAPRRGHKTEREDSRRDHKTEREDSRRGKRRRSRSVERRSNGAPSRRRRSSSGSSSPSPTRGRRARH